MCCWPVCAEDDDSQMQSGREDFSRLLYTYAKKIEQRGVFLLFGARG